MFVIRKICRVGRLVTGEQFFNSMFSGHIIRKQVRFRILKFTEINVWLNRKTPLYLKRVPGSQYLDIASVQANDVLQMAINGVWDSPNHTYAGCIGKYLFFIAKLFDSF